MVALVGINPRVNQSFFAAGASGGPASAAALAQSVLEAGLGKDQVDSAAIALAQPRFFQGGLQAPVLHEPGVKQSVLANLQKNGATLTQSSAIGRVNLAYCSDGLPRSPATCSFAADRRGFGLATGQQF
jgi:gamma-glutamyltranspeptidase/glutathione hydrolase